VPYNEGGHTECNSGGLLRMEVSELPSFALARLRYILCGFYRLDGVGLVVRCNSVPVSMMRRREVFWAKSAMRVPAKIQLEGR
jgi:hypothetical protein